MDDLEHLPLPPDEPAFGHGVEQAPIAPIPLEFVRPIVPVPPVAVPLGRRTALVAVPGTTRRGVKKVRLAAVLMMTILGAIGILLSGSYAIFKTYSQLPPLSSAHAKPVIRKPHPVAPPPAVKAVTTNKHKTRLKSHSKKAPKKTSKSKSSLHKPWFSNPGAKGA